MMSTLFIIMLTKRKKECIIGITYNNINKFNPIKDMLNLIDRIETGVKTEFEGKQLSCISKLVFYCGVQAKEIPELRIRDVIGKDGGIIRKIKIEGGRDINLNGAAFKAVQDYIADLRQKRPSLIQSHERLFPGYPNIDKLKRDWKRFGLNYRIIKEAGYVHFRDSERQKGTSDALINNKGAEQLRVTTRQFRAVATGHKIPAGVPIDNRCVDEIMRLYGQAERLNKRAPNAAESAHSIMDEFEECLNRIRSDEVREKYEGLRFRFEELLRPYLK
jgi:integrase